MPPPDDNPFSQQHIFFRSVDGHVQHVFWDPAARAFFADVWTRRKPAPLAAGDIAALSTDCRQHVFYRDVVGNVVHMFWDVPSATLHYVVLTQVTANARFAAGNPVPLETPDQMHVFYRGVGDTLEHIFWNPASAVPPLKDTWTSHLNAAPIVGDPAVLSTPGQQHAFYRGGDGGIHHIVQNAGTTAFGVDNWTTRSTGSAPAPPAAADPVALAVGDQQHVFYRGADGSINHIYWAPFFTAPKFDDWTAGADAPPATGERIAALFASGQQHVFYRAQGGGIEHILWNSGTGLFGKDDWRSRSGAPAAAGDPISLATFGQQHIFYADVSGSIVHIFWQNGFAHPVRNDWTTPSGAAAIAGRITAFTSSDAPDPLALRVLPLGDSMTEGFAVQNTGGYRAPLFQLAHSAGKHMVFVGSRFDGPAKVEDDVCFPAAHEGHNGKNIAFIAGLMPGVLASKPKIVLLMIGANDVLTRRDVGYKEEVLDAAPDRLRTLLDALLASDADMLVVVAQIPPMNPCYPSDPRNPNHVAVAEDVWTGAIQKYNHGVESVVAARRAQGKHVILVDMSDGFAMKSMLRPEDGIHPNRLGYEHIAKVWYQAINGFLP